MCEMIDRIESNGRKKLADQLMKVAEEEGCADFVAALISRAEKGLQQGS